MGRFEEVITTRERLRELNKLPSHRAGNKAIDHIDDICRRFIAACPFVMVASRGADGRLDLSPKGDPPGFVAVLDERMLAIPDRLGNNRLDTFENLLIHPEVGLFFIMSEVHRQSKAVEAGAMAGSHECSDARRGHGGSRRAIGFVPKCKPLSRTMVPSASIDEVC